MEKEHCLEAVAKDEHGSGLDRIGSGLKPILTRSGPVMATWSRSRLIFASLRLEGFRSGLGHEGYLFRSQPIVLRLWTLQGYGWGKLL